MASALARLNFIRIGKDLFNPTYIRRIQITDKNASIVFRNTDACSTGCNGDHLFVRDNVFTYCAQKQKPLYDQIMKLTEGI